MSERQSESHLEGFVHRYIPASDGSEAAQAPTLLLLHGTGGDENDLVGVGQLLLPGANLLSPRGKVLERGMNRYFRRVAESVFDQEDLRFRTDELVRFIESASKHYRFDISRVIAVGYSNGANISGSLLFRHPDMLYGAVLLHPMVPFEPDVLPALQGKPIFIAAGHNDPIVLPENTRRLEEILRASGAEVSDHWHEGGHSITRSELDAARNWLRETFTF